MPDSSLTQFGFTELESDIYLALLQHGASTGYAVSKEINKPVANVYKALESLSGKGAVMQSRSEKKLFKAVPWENLVEELQNRHQSSLDKLKSEFEVIPKKDEDEQVYQLANVEQTVAEGLRIIKSAQFIVLADLEPAAVPLFSEALEAAAARGVEVRIKVYRPVSVTGVKVLVREHGEQIYESTRDVSLSIVADGRAFVIGLFNTALDAVIQAFTSGSALMNLELYSKLVYEFTLTELKPVIHDGDIDAARKILEDTQHLHPLSTRNPVYDYFAERYRFAR